MAYLPVNNGKFMESVLRVRFYPHGGRSVLFTVPPVSGARDIFYRTFHVRVVLVTLLLCHRVPETHSRGSTGDGIMVLFITEFNVL